MPSLANMDENLADVDHLDRLMQCLDYIAMNDDLDKEEREQKFIRQIFSDPVLRSTVKMNDLIENCQIRLGEEYDDLYNGRSIIDDAILELSKVARKYPNAHRLSQLLKSPHMKHLLSCYDDVCNTRFEPELPEVDWPNEYSELSLSSMPPTTTSHDGGGGYAIPLSPNSQLRRGSLQPFVHRGGTISAKSDPSFRISSDSSQQLSLADLPQLVGIRKEANESLGLTVVREDSIRQGVMLSRIIVERIITGSVIEKQGLLNPGDVILEINDQPVETPEAMQKILRQIPSGIISMKILPGAGPKTQGTLNADKSSTYMRALFTYNPSKDSLLPTGNIGLGFDVGDILEIVSNDDPNFWQARLFENCGNRKVGLIPSPMLEERRKAFNPSDSKPKSKKKEKTKMFRTADASDIFDRSDLWTYEEVVQVPLSLVTCILLVGASGVGKKSLKHALCSLQPQKFAPPIVDCSRSSGPTTVDQDPIRYTKRSKMEADRREGEYAEFWESGKDCFGVKISSIREIIDRGRTAVLDCSPKSVRFLRRPEINPHVLFVAAPSLETLIVMQEKGVKRGILKKKKTESELKLIVDQSTHIERFYRHLFNSVLLNDNFDMTMQRLAGLVRRLEKETSWVPASWEMDRVPLLRPLPKPPEDGSIPTTLERRYMKKHQQQELRSSVSHSTLSSFSSGILQDNSVNYSSIVLEPSTTPVNHLNKAGSKSEKSLVFSPRDEPDVEMEYAQLDFDKKRRDRAELKQNHAHSSADNLDNITQPKLPPTSSNQIRKASLNSTTSRGGLPPLPNPSQKPKLPPPPVKPKPRGFVVNNSGRPTPTAPKPLPSARPRTSKPAIVKRASTSSETSTEESSSSEEDVKVANSGLYV